MIYNSTKSLSDQQSALSSIDLYMPNFYTGISYSNNKTVTTPYPEKTVKSSNKNKLKLLLQ